MPNRTRSETDVDLQAKIVAEVDAVLERTLRSDSYMQTLASVLTDLVANKLKESMEFNENLISGLQKKLEERDREIDSLKAQLELKTDQLEMYTRRNSIRIFGIKETDGENTDALAIGVAEKISVELSISDIDRSHRVGPKTPGRNRPIIVKFVSYRKRKEVFRAKRKLKGEKITIREDLTRLRLQVLHEAIRRFDLKNVWTEDGTVVINTGAHVVMACRDVPKAEAAARGVRERALGAAGVGDVRVVRLDLASLASVRACARHLLASEPRIHLLINNAGIMACPKMRTEDGFEMQMGVNHLGHFLLTCLLLPRLRASAPARIVNVSSLAHCFGHIDFDDLNWEKSNYNATFAYGRSKLANILFTKELAKRLKDTEVTTYSLHPGAVATMLGRHYDTAYFKGVTWLFNNIAKYFIKSPEQGAQTTIICAVSEETSKESGFYYSGSSKSRTSREAQNPEVAERLWQESMKLVGLEEWDPITATETPDIYLNTTVIINNHK